MNFHLVVYYTDALFFLLLTVIGIFIILARKLPHIQNAWHKVLKNRVAVISMCVLCVYGMIGLLDSIHLQANHTHRTQSVFDMLLSPLDKQDEKTYSAPFATHLYSQEIITQADGKQIRTYPLLRYVDLNKASIAANVLQHTLKTTAIGFISCLLFIFLFIVLRALWQRKNFLQCVKEIIKNQTPVPWRLIFISFAVLFLVLFNLLDLSRHYHVLGTDRVGQDVFYQSLKSIRTGLLIGTLTTLIMLPFAIIMGTVAGYFRGWVDDVVQYIYTTLSSVPEILLIAAVILSLQIFIANHAEYFPNLATRADLRLLALCFILGITNWTDLCRLLRGETLKLREMDYITAARVLGVKQRSIILQHIVPNFMHLVLIAVVMNFSGLVLAEAVLTYVGVGVDPTTISWGNMINAARLELAREPVVWWPLLAAFSFMFVLVIAANLFADSLRDALDPKFHH